MYKKHRIQTSFYWWWWLWCQWLLHVGVWALSENRTNTVYNKRKKCLVINKRKITSWPVSFANFWFSSEMEQKNYQQYELKRKSFSNVAFLQVSVLSQLLMGIVEINWLKPVRIPYSLTIYSYIMSFSLVLPIRMFCIRVILSYIQSFLIIVSQSKRKSP